MQQQRNVSTPTTMAADMTISRRGEWNTGAIPTVFLGIIFRVPRTCRESSEMRFAHTHTYSPNPILRKHIGGEADRYQIWPNQIAQSTTANAGDREKRAGEISDNVSGCHGNAESAIFPVYMVHKKNTRTEKIHIKPIRGVRLGCYSQFLFLVALNLNCFEC